MVCNSEKRSNGYEGKHETFRLNEFKKCSIMLHCNWGEPQPILVDEQTPTMQKVPGRAEQTHSGPSPQTHQRHVAYVPPHTHTHTQQWPNHTCEHACNHMVGNLPTHKRTHDLQRPPNHHTQLYSTCGRCHFNTHTSTPPLCHITARPLNPAHTHPRVHPPNHATRYTHTHTHTAD